MRYFWREFYNELGPIAVGVVTFVVLMGALVPYFLFGAIRESVLAQRCLRAGYPGVRVTWEMSGFCVKRLEQTDVVVPIDAVP